MRSCALHRFFREPSYYWAVKKIKVLSILVVSLVAAMTRALAQQPAKPAPTAAELKKNFARIERGTEGESAAFDKLTATTARQLVAYLKTHEVSAAAAKNLGLDLSIDSHDAAHFKVFTYSYASGGTRGTVHRTVFQWQNQTGKLFAYSFGEEGALGELYKMPSPGRTQYLLLGNERGSGICERAIAFLVELKGDYLLLDKQAFANKPTLDICNTEFSYDARQQALVVVADSTFGDPDVYADTPFQPFKLYFSQGRFVKNK